jgi:cytochrome c553
MERTARRRVWTAAAIACILLGSLGTGCPEPPQPEGSADPGSARAPAAASPTSAATFEATVRPILATRCAPCHNPGGKMYDTLPFDQPAVVSSHATGIRRRLKGEDLAALEKWLATLPAAGPASERS